CRYFLRRSRRERVDYHGPTHREGRARIRRDGGGGVAGGEADGRVRKLHESFSASGPQATRACAGAAWSNGDLGTAARICYTLIQGTTDYGQRCGATALGRRTEISAALPRAADRI